MSVLGSTPDILSLREPRSPTLYLTCRPSPPSGPIMAAGQRTRRGSEAASRFIGRCEVRSGTAADWLDCRRRGDHSSEHDRLGPSYGITAYVRGEVREDEDPAHRGFGGALLSKPKSAGLLAVPGRARTNLIWRRYVQGARSRSVWAKLGPLKSETGSLRPICPGKEAFYGSGVGKSRSPLTKNRSPAMSLGVV